MKIRSLTIAAALMLGAVTLSGFDIPFLWLESPSGRTNKFDPKSPLYVKTATPAPAVSAPSPDGFESDNTSGTAGGINTTGGNQTHSLHTSTDWDYVSFTATVGNTYTINTTSLSGGTDTILALYTSSLGLITSNDNNIGYESQIVFTALASGIYYVRVSGGSASTYGTYSSYSLNVSEALPGSTATVTLTFTETPLPGSTSTFTRTLTGTPPPGSTSTFTSTVTPTPTVTPTSTVTQTDTPSPTSTVTPSITETSTMTPTNTVTPSNTAFAGSATNTPTYTMTPSITVTVTPTFTSTYTSTSTPSITPTFTCVPVSVVYEDNETGGNAAWGGAWGWMNSLNPYTVGTTNPRTGAYSWEFWGVLNEVANTDFAYNPWFGLYDALSPSTPSPIGSPCASTMFFWINSDTTFDMNVYLTQGAGSNCDTQTWITSTPVTIQGDSTWHKVVVPAGDMIYEGVPACPGMPIDYNFVSFPWFMIASDIATPGANFFIDEIGFE